MTRGELRSRRYDKWRVLFSILGVTPPVLCTAAPDDVEAWYAPEILIQRTAHPNVVTTVREPALLPGDERLIEACKECVWEATVSGTLDVEDRAAFVRERAATLLRRRLTARNTRAWVEATRRRVRSALAEYGFTVPPVDGRYSRDRLDDLLYYVVRDFVGEGQLTVPIRDPNLEDVEANRVVERGLP